MASTPDSHPLPFPPDRAHATVTQAGTVKGNPTKSAQSSNTTASLSRKPTTGWFIYLIIFVAGIASLSMEMGASRLLNPYFGSSLSTWGILIGLTMIFLAAGYPLGGWLGDRFASERGFYTIAAISGRRRWG